MEVLGMLSAAGAPTQGLLPTREGSTAGEFAAVLDELDLQPAEATEDMADPAPGNKEADDPEEPSQPEVEEILACPTVAPPVPDPMTVASSNASLPEGDGLMPVVATVDAILARNRPAPPELALATNEKLAGDFALPDVEPAAVVLLDASTQQGPEPGEGRAATAQRASVAIAPSVIPAHDAAPPAISAISKPETHDVIRESQPPESTNCLELPDLANFTISVHEGRLASLTPDSHTTTRAPHGADVRHVLQQLGDKLFDGTEGVVEIALSPEELGKVRLVIAPGEKPAVTVYADRPETYELLRRNAEALDKELRSAGIFGADISFSGGNDTPGNRKQAFSAASRSSGQRDHIVNFAEHSAAPKVRTVVDRRIDIRI